MVKVRMLVAMAGDDFSWAAGDVVDVDDAMGAALCSEPVDSPRAVPVDGDAPAPVERRVRKQRETRAS